MRTPLHLRGPLYATVCLLLICTSFLASVATTSTVVAQGEECPEGLVYYEPDDICLLPENVPDDEDVDDGDQPPDEEPIDDEDLVDEEDLTDEEDIVDEGDATDEEDLVDEEDILDEEDLVEDEDLVDEGEAVDEFDDLTDEDDQMDDADDQGLIDDEETGEIENITLLTFSCPVNWNPETREKSDNYSTCTLPQPDGTYSIQREGEDIATLGAPGKIDLKVDLPGLLPRAGMWTLQQNPVDSLQPDPYVLCSIYAADNTTRMTVIEVVVGGKLDVLLAEGEELFCEWFSLATVPEVTGDPNALPIGELRVSVFSCPVGFDVAAIADLNELAVCDYDRAPIFTFEAYRNNELVSTQSDNGNLGLIDFQAGLDTRLLSGSYRIVGSIPPGYIDPQVGCSITSEGGESTNVPVAPVSGTIELEIPPGSNVMCMWLNLEAQPRPEQSRGISVVVHTCPSDYDVETKSKAEAMAACTLPMPVPVTFEFIQNGQVLATGTSTSEALYISVSQSGALPNAGVWTFRILQPPGSGLSKGFCEGSDTAGMVTSATTMTAFGDDADITIAPNELVNCHWFTVPGARSDIIQVTAHACPEGFNPADPTAGDKFTTCPPKAGVEYDFQLDGNSMFKTTTGASGVAGTNVLAGLNKIVQSPLEGFGKPFVICDQTSAATGQVQTIEAPINSDQRSVTFDLDAGDRLTCDWFNVPGALELPPPAIEIVTHLCPPTVEIATASGDILFAECAAPAAGAEFELSSGDNEIGTETTDDDGRAGFANLPVDDDGNATYMLGLNGDPGAVRVLCKNNPLGGEGPAFDARISADNAIVQPMTLGDTLTCEWFIQPEEADGGAGNDNGGNGDEDGNDENDGNNGGNPGNRGPAGNVLTIQIHLCPATSQQDDDYGDLLMSCGPDPSGVKIELAQENRTSQESTAAPLASWTNIAEGTATLTWNPIDFPAPVVVYCSYRWRDADGIVHDQFPELQPVLNESFALDFTQPETQMFCDWFSFPPGVAQSPALNVVLQPSWLPL